jgi:hypothetical protein
MRASFLMTVSINSTLCQCMAGPTFHSWMLGVSPSRPTGSVLPGYFSFCACTLPSQPFNPGAWIHH